MKVERMRILLLLLMAPLAALAQATSADLTIACQDKVCTASPDYIPLVQQKQIHVTSEVEWNCFFYHPQPGAATAAGDRACRAWTNAPPQNIAYPALIFEARDGNKNQVIVPLLLALPQTNSESGGSNLLPVAVALLAIASAGISLMLWLKAAHTPHPSYTAEERMRQEIEPLAQSVERIGTILQFPETPMSVPERPRPAGPSEETRRTVPRPVTADSRPATKIEKSELIRALDDWSKIAGNPPESSRMHGPLLGIGPGTPAEETQAIAQQIAQMAVRSTDAMDATRRNIPLQVALGSLVNAAGLSLIEPQERDSFDDTRHFTSSAGVRPPSDQLHGRIAEVRRRGLERNGRVVEKAEVILYD